MNKSYGSTMSEYLSCEKFKWFKKINEFDVMSINEERLIGCLWEVDLKYPDKSLELNNDYSLAPEKLAASSDMLSKYCKKLLIDKR